MGRLYKFECSNCGYSEEVSGGNDTGMICQTTTILCKDCQELYDVVIKYHRQEEVKELVCPENNQHEIRSWNYPDTCPVCGEKMKIDKNTIIMWD